MESELNLLDEIVLEILENIDDAIFENISDEVSEEELLLEVKAIKRKVIRSLLMTIKYQGCPDGYRVDPDSKQCVKMSTAEKKLMHKLAKRGAKLFKKRGTGAAIMKAKRRIKSLAVGNRMHLYKHAKKKP